MAAESSEISQTPRSPTRQSGFAASSHPLKSPMTETDSPCGAQTRKRARSPTRWNPKYVNARCSVPRWKLSQQEAPRATLRVCSDLEGAAIGTAFFMATLFLSESALKNGGIYLTKASPFLRLLHIVLYHNLQNNQGGLFYFWKIRPKLRQNHSDSADFGSAKKAFLSFFSGFPRLAPSSQKNES